MHFFFSSKECKKNASLSLDDVQRCKSALNAYTFPVQSMVLSINGTILNKLNANDLIDLSNKLNEKRSFLDATFIAAAASSSSFSTSTGDEIEDPIGNVYLKFLNEGVAQQ